MTKTRITTATLLLLFGALIASVPLLQAAAKRTGQDAENACLDTYNSCYSGCTGNGDNCYTLCDARYQQCMAASGVVFVKLKKHPQVGPINPVLDKGASTEGNMQIVKSPDAKKRIIAKLSKRLKPRQRAELITLIDQSLLAIQNGDGPRATQGITKIKAIAAQNEGDGEDSPLLSCGLKCKHHLDDGNPIAYGACYWACVIWSSKPTQGVIDPVKPPVKR